MKYEILDDQGNVVNVIISTPDFVEKHYAGHYREVVDAPPRETVLSQYEFLKRFTAEERIAARNLAKTNDLIFDFMDLLYRATSVDCKNADTIAGLQALEAFGVLAPGRAAEILGE